MSSHTRPEPVVPADDALPTRWGPDRRLEFIDFRLRWEGRVNRSDLTDFFGISVPRASLDIARYLELAPGNLQYDRRARVYLVGPDFQAVFPTTNKPSRYLNELLATATGVLESGASFLGWQPPVGLVPAPARTLDVNVLTALLKAIREGGNVDVLYQSLTKVEPNVRTLAPHAIAHDGFRWHVRAYCFTRERYLDFVIARMLSLTRSQVETRPTFVDLDWEKFVSVALTPNPALSKPHRKAIELDYGMTDGHVNVECRLAMLFYVLQHLGLNEGSPTRPEAQQVVLKNKAELQPYLDQVAHAPIG